MFLAGGICLGGSGLMADQVALQAIREAGGIVRPMGGGWEIEFQRKGKAMSSDSLEKVALLGDSVVALNLRGTLTTDEGLRQLEGLSNLGRLHLERTEVGDEGMAHLAGLKKLSPSPPNARKPIVRTIMRVWISRHKGHTAASVKRR